MEANAIGLSGLMLLFLLLWSPYNTNVLGQYIPGYIDPQPAPIILREEDGLQLTGDPQISTSTPSSISLAIVFDSTGSMGDDLKQVKLGARKILQRHLERGREALIKDFVLVKVHDPDVGPPRVTTSTKTFYQYLDSVYTQGGGDCPEMTITGIEMALEASQPNSLIYVFTDSSAKDYDRLPRVLNLIQKKQSQVVFVLTGFCNSTDEIGFQAYQEIATVSSGQVYIIGKRQVTEFMRVIEAAVEARKVQVLQQDTWETSAKTYSFPVDSHLSQLTIQVTNFKTNDPIRVGIRNPEGKLITKDDGLRQLMKTVPSVFVASIDHPTPGTWTLEVSTDVSEQQPGDDEKQQLQWHSVRVSGISEVDFVPGFATNPLPYNVGSSRRPIDGIKNYVMANITGRLLTGSVDSIVLRAPNGTSLVRLPVERTPSTHVYVSQHAMESVTGPYYLQVSGRDGQGYNFQRYSKVALMSRKARPVVVTCPAKLEVARGDTAFVTCLIDSEVPFTVNWYQNGRQLTGFSGEHQIFSVPTNVTYTLTDVNEESQGIYSAEMISTGLVVDGQVEGQRKDDVAVVILPPPPTVLIPRNASVEPNGVARLMCTVFSQAEEVEVSWYRGHEVRFKLKDSRRHQIRKSTGGGPSAEIGPLGQTFTSSLQITDVQNSDVGEYICEAEHKGGVSSAAGFVIIHVRPRVVAESEVVEFKDGGRLVLSCRVEGHPPPDITWAFNDVPIPEGIVDQEAEIPRTLILNDYMESRLVISPTEAIDAGRYTCQAENSAGEDKVDIQARFIARPEIIRLDTSREMPQEGEILTMRCLAVGEPSPIIKWEFNGSPVGEGTNIRLNETTGELEILHMKRHMSGKWTCVAENVAGTTKSSVSIEVGHQPKMDINTMQDRVFGEFASDLLIPCVVDGNPTPQIKWFKMTGDTQVPVSYGDRYTLAADNSLHIRNLDMDDGATFICEASNTYGRDQYHVSVELGGVKAPTISFTDPQQFVLEGSPEKILHCTVLDARPAATVTWLKDSQEIDLNSPKYTVLDNNLVIRGVEMENEGVYTCVAQNVVGRSKIDIELDVQTKPVFTDPTPHTMVETTQGKMLELHCAAEGDPKPKVEWRKDGRLVVSKGGSLGSSGPSVVLSPDGYTLTIYSVTDTSSGTFTCSAINAHSVATKEFQVNVKTPPSISKEGFTDIEIGKGEMAFLTCLVSYGSPTPRIEWFKNGIPLREVPNRIVILDNGHTVEIRGEKEDESGSYECRAENEVGRDSRFYQVTVLVPPTYTTTHTARRLLVRLGDRVEIECGMAGFPEPEISWTWMGKPLEGKLGDLGMSIRPSRDGSASLLTLMDMTAELQGNFTCVGRNRGGSTSVDYDVILLSEPKIVDFSERAVVFLNNTITLTCETTGNPKPNISWWFMGREIIPNLAPGYRMVGDGNLMIQSARRQHGGEYTCVAENEAGRDSKTATITVFEPSGERPLAQNITTITMGGNITFTCKLTSNPPPRIKWFKDNIDLYSAMPQNRYTLSSDESTLTIFNVVPEDQGQYKCEAENIPGDWDISYYLEVTSSPVIMVGSSSRLKEQVRQGQDIRLRCIATGSPEPTYQWLKDDTPIASTNIPMGAGPNFSLNNVELSTVSERYALHDQGRELVVQSAKEIDSGIYTCIAVNTVGRDRHNMQISVLSKPIFDDGLDHETPELQQHEPAMLWCNATGSPNPKFKWTSDLIIDQKNEFIRSMHNGQALFFPNVTQSLISRFICTATNEAGSARRIFDPSLIHKPRLTGSEGENPRSVVRNGDTQLTCEWDANPDATIEWFKGGELITYMDFPRVNTTARNTVLYLHDAQLEDAGIYRCVVTNKVGSTRRQWNLLIMSPPQFQFSSPIGTHNLPLGSSLTLFCVAEGEPKPTIRWTKNGLPIDTNRFNISENGVHLTLPAVEESDAGRFACIATSPYGEISRSFDAKITYAPRLDGDGQRQYSLERTVGSSAILECLVIGNPSPTIQWFKDGNPLDPLPFRYRLFNQKRELEILSIQPMDAGRYRCLASNEIGSLEVSVDMTVGAPPRIDRGRLRSEYVIKEGDELVLPCPATGSPFPRLNFTRSEIEGDTNRVIDRQLGQPTTDSDIQMSTDQDSIGRRTVVSQDRQTLTIFRAKKGDGGSYQCNASNEIGWDTMKYLVRVRVPPSFDTSNVQPEVHWFVNQTRFLDCTLHGYADPPAKITWERHGVPVTSNANHRISPDGSKLTVAKVSLGDVGDYKCVASNEVGRTSQEFRVLVFVRPQFVNPIRKINIDAIQNQTVHLSCEVTGDPPPRITWFKRDVELFPSNSFSQQGSSVAGVYSMRYPNLMPLQGDQVLQLTNVQKEDAGDYTCMASNGGDAIEKKFNLTVILPPTILKPQGSPEGHSTREHDPVTFHCLIRDYNNTQPEIVWTKDGAPILMSDDGDYFLVQEGGQMLTVIRPTSSESGMFRCEAKNKAGIDNHQFKLVVIASPRFPTDFIRYREKLVQQIGSQVRLECPVTGSPPPVITWYYNGSPLLPYTAPTHYNFDAESKLLHFITGKKDAGEFRCIAHNEAGNITKTYELEVIMPPLVRLDRTEMREREGATFTIQCIAEGHPTPKLEWSRSSGGLFRTGTSVDLSTGILTITEARKEDTARYTCTATNKISRDSKTVDVQIIERPVIQTTATSIVANEDDQVLLPCTVTGTPPIQIQWRLPSGQQVTQDEIVGFQVLPQQGLLIERISRTHAGLYRCSANNEAGSQNAVLSLEVHVKPRLVRPASTDVSGRLNSVLQLNCEVNEGIPKPIVIWERHGISFSRTKSFYTTTDSGLFIFNALKIQDEGEWICVARNPAGEDRLAFNVIVHTPPTITLPLSSVGYEGKSVTIDCKVEGKPMPEISWEFKNQPIAAILGSRARVEPPNRLMIHNLQPEDAGNFFCVAKLPGQEMVMDSTYLTVFTIPKFISTPNATVEAYEDRWIQLRCTAEGHPKPDIKWIHQREPVHGTSSHNGMGSLVIGPLRETHSGQYSCIASNEAGKKEYSFRLNVKTRPKVYMYQSDQPFRGEKRTALHCNVSGEADSIVWLKDGTPMYNSSRMHINNDGSSLVISMAKAGDTGTYQCIAANIVGEDFGELRLVIESSPYLVKSPQNTTASMGEIVTLECHAEGHPAPYIAWYHNNRSVEMSVSHSLVRNGSLRIVGVRERDEGVYHCVASSNQGEAISGPAELKIQVPGGWSDWLPWQSCSVSCGRGTQMRERVCDSPSPKNGGSYCIGDKSEQRSCLKAFCPVDGVWSSWTPWSSCSSPCGAGLRHRKRQCDSPPPSNGGSGCEGEAVEDELCEDLPLCPVNGAWSSWGPWSTCSRTCGSGSTQRRERKCDMPLPANGGRACLGQESVVRACERKSCPVDGGWGDWSPWTHCSRSCGGGIRRRTRPCNNPTPAFGGAQCSPDEGATETTECHENPCPVHGGWSNWGSWSSCIGRCGHGVQSRSRTCTEPKPGFGGHLCRGSAKEKETCNLPVVSDGEACPGGLEGSNMGFWSKWSGWSECVADCTIMSQEVNKGKRSRVRDCIVVYDNKEVLAQSLRDCTGHAEEVEKCFIPLENIDCAAQNRSLSGMLVGELHGWLNGVQIRDTRLIGNWSATSSKTTGFDIQFQGVAPEHALCLQTLSEIVMPAFWYSAREIAHASNGENVIGDSRSFSWNSVGQFADGSSVRLKQQLRKSDESDNVAASTVLTLNSTIMGDCPESLKSAQEGTHVELANFRQQVVQMNPSSGSSPGWRNSGTLHSSSSRTYSLVDMESRARRNEPYAWSSEVVMAAGRRQRFLSQNLFIEQIRLTPGVNGLDYSFSMSAETAVDKDANHALCPEGFEMVEARLEGRWQLMSEANIDYCRDVDECSSSQLNYCDQICENTSPGFKCGCYEGYRLSTDGRSCLDIDECSDAADTDKAVCPAGKRCLNTAGAYECVQGCGEGLKSAAFGYGCEDIDECRNGVDVCEGHQCVNTYGGYYCSCRSGFELVGNRCHDVDECQSGRKHCRDNEVCVNVPGSFQCDAVCSKGYRVERSTTNGDPKCVDIDECVIGEGERMCPQGATCENMPGSFRCFCPDGHQSVGNTCQTITPQHCDQGFKWSSKIGNCIDIDECNSTNSRNVCQYQCENTYGGYRCSCPQGYEVNPLSNTCKDIDECKTSWNKCNRGELCINTPGSYKCIQPNCPKDYQYDRKSQSCRIPCSVSSLPCPQGARYADSVQYLSVNIPRSRNAMDRNILLRVVDWHQVQQANCHYQLLDKAKETPVLHRSEKGVVYLTPDRASPIFQEARDTETGRYLLAETSDSERSAQNSSSSPPLFYLFFRVSCFAGKAPGVSSVGRQEFDVYPVGRFNNSKLIFQHSFYVYISVSKYPF